MSWKRIVGDNKRGLLGDAQKKVRGNPIPPQIIVPTKGKHPKKKERRETKDKLRNGDFDD